MLLPSHCVLFDRPFFQFAQLKKFAPETIPQLKADYKAAWQVWRETVLRVAEILSRENPHFAAPHIERWCNGWQVRAHFFAYFKYARHENDAAIFSVLLNRRRLTVSLDWHCYKAARSTIALPQYNRWTENADRQRYAGFDVWHGSESEYADYETLERQPENVFTLRDADDFFCIGRHIMRDDLGKTDSAQWIAAQISALIPLYESCFEAA